MNLTFKILVTLAIGFLTAFVFFLAVRDDASPIQNVFAPFLIGIVGAVTALRWFLKGSLEITRTSVAVAAGYCVALFMFLTCLQSGSAIWASLLLAVILGVWVCKMVVGDKYALARMLYGSNSVGGP